jgi:hypothetical protein
MAEIYNMSALATESNMGAWLLVINEMGNTVPLTALLLMIVFVTFGIMQSVTGSVTKSLLASTFTGGIISGLMIVWGYAEGYNAIHPSIPAILGLIAGVMILVILMKDGFN